MGYLLHTYAVLFHPALDELNGFRTVVYDWKGDIFHKVNSFGYGVLRQIDKNPGTTLKGLVGEIAKARKESIWQNEQKVKNFVEQMIKENVIIEQ